MRIQDLKVEHIESSFKDTRHKVELSKPKPEIQYNPCTSF